MNWYSRKELMKERAFSALAEGASSRIFYTSKGQTCLAIYTLCTQSFIGWVVYRLLRTVWEESFRYVLVSALGLILLTPVIVGFSTHLYANIRAAMVYNARKFSFKRQSYKFTDKENVNTKKTTEL